MAVHLVKEFFKKMSIDININKSLYYTESDFKF